MTYTRVMPRDLFNEADLLKMLGKLWIATEGMENVQFEDIEPGDHFDITQNEDSGGLFVSNINFYVRGFYAHLERPLNTRKAWSLYAYLDGEEYSVFDCDGNLSEILTSLIKGEPL